MEEACKFSLSFFSDQQLCYADILTPPEIIARIQVAVLNFLRILTAPAPAISDLPLLIHSILFQISNYHFSATKQKIITVENPQVARKWSNSHLNQGLLTQTSWIFLTNALHQVSQSSQRHQSLYQSVEGNGHVLRFWGRRRKSHRGSFSTSCSANRQMISPLNRRCSGIASLQPLQPRNHGV